MNGRASVDWYRLSPEETSRRLGTTPVSGLTETEARARAAEYGPNEIADYRGRGPWQILLSQLAGVMTLVLFAAAAISVVLGDVLDAAVIVAIIVLNAAFGFFQEYRAEQSMAALKRMSAPVVHVRRDSQVREISSRDLVPGDIVLLETGNIVPADGRLLQANNLRVQEAALTGESEAVEKDAGIVFETDRVIGDRRNMVYSGTIVTYGHGETTVTATGMETELGKIAGLLQSVGEEQTPLQRRLDRLGRMLAAAALLLVIVVFALGVLSGEDWQVMLLTSVSLAVAAIPEAMTAVVTIALSLGAQRMLKRQALIRQLPAVETLGSVNVICSDKTGTLTQNRMTVTALDIANHRIQFVQRSGRGLELVPDHSPERPGVQPALDLLMIAGALCSDAVLQEDERQPGTYRALGDPTEGALVVAAAQMGILQSDLNRAFPRVGELPFDSERKRMTTVHRVPRSRTEIPPGLAPVWERRVPPDAPPPYLAATKGALDGMLAITAAVWVEGQPEPLDDGWRSRLEAAHDDLARSGMRILGVGVRPLDQAPGAGELASLERDLILLGLVAMIDPPRPEVREAVQLCRMAGIRPVMITGDHPLTARYIAHEVGIAEDERFVTGRALEGLSEEDLRKTTEDVAVFARVSPEHKIRLVRAYQDEGDVVAMTGDGVNDAPALKRADIGVAMGITGTDVAKEAAKMVLLDDNFATIVSAVREGRVVYDNIRRFIKYLLTCNASEIAVMIVGPLLGMPLPLQPLQILWMNLVTDGPPALALGVEPAEEDVMRRPPQAATESIFGRGMIPYIVVLGVIASVVSIGAGLFAFLNGDAHWQTLLFTTLIFSQAALALSVRSETRPLWKIGLLSNRAMLGALVVIVLLQLAVVYVPAFQTILGTSALPVTDLLVAVLSGALVLVAAEVWKLVLRRRGSGHRPTMA